jgi:hypothetical protein
VEQIRKTSLLPNIRDDAINAMLGITQGNLSYAHCAEMFIVFLWRSRQHLKDDLWCVRFINGLANFLPHTQVKSHRSQ